MKKKFFISVACVAAIALFLFCQKITSFNSVVASNVEALTDGDPSIPFSITITSEPIYVWAKEGTDAYYLPPKDYTVQGETVSRANHSWMEWVIWFFTGCGPMSGDEYLCARSLAQVQSIYHCYTITVD